jgi:TRAP-type C4-dicarboxylate transport system substrate-binding protein
MVKPLKSLDAVAGLKLIVTGKERSVVVSRLGFTPVTGASSDMYPMLQRHVADGTAVAWAAFDTYKLAEVTTYHVDAPLGGSTAIVIMTKKRYDALSAAGRKAIDDNSDEKQTRFFGATWDRNADENKAATAALPGQVITKLDPPTAERWKQISEPVLTQWAAGQPNGAEVLAKFRALLAEAEATIR